MYSEDQLRAYRALSIAADKIGSNNFRRGFYGKRRGGYSLTQAHDDVVKAMPQVLSGSLSVNDAMGLLHRGDVFEERFPK